MIPGEHEILETTTYPETVALAGDLPEGFIPDCILLDLEMPGIPGGDSIAGVREICELFKPSRVVVFSGTHDGPTVAQALKAGAAGYLPKTASAKTFIAALNFVLSGETYVPPIAVDAVSPPPAPKPAQSLLTEKEYAALQRLISGMTNKEIARELEVQEITIKVWLRSAYRKIGASNRIDAVRIAMDRGLVGREEE
jgi:DNA-binding NarL/FixJ family response regulator